MRNELLSWFAREGLLLQDVLSSAEDPEHDEIKKTINELIGGSDFASRWEFRSSCGEAAAAAAESRYEFMIYNAT